MTIDHKLEISEVKNGRDELTSLSNMAFGETGILQSVLEMVESKGVIITAILPRVTRPLTKVSIGRLVCQMEVMALFS